MLTSKGASGVTGAGFITLAATLAVVNPALVPGMAIVFSDRQVHERGAARSPTSPATASPRCSCRGGRANSITTKLHARLNRQIDPSDVETAVTTG